MSGQSPVSPARKLHDADVVYLYDGSFEGFLCCVFESFAQHELPFAVWTPERETIRSCGSSDFCIWPLRWGQAPSSGGATRRWLRSTR